MNAEIVLHFYWAKLKDVWENMEKNVRNFERGSHALSVAVRILFNKEDLLMNFSYFIVSLKKKAESKFAILS